MICTVLTLLLSIGGFAQHISSSLFNSSTYDANRLRNFTAAGYRGGTKPIPNYPIKANVLSFGATPNDTISDLQAFKAAIIACGDSGTIYIPAGEYYVNDSIQIRKKCVVLKGAGQGKTILRFTKGLRELYPMDTAVSSNFFSWSFALITFQGSSNNTNSSGTAIEDAGIENLTIAFPDNKWEGHNFYERGYNAIGFDRFASHCWVRNIKIIGCDMGVWVATKCNNITIQNIEFSAGPIRSNSTPVLPNYDGGKIGHHGINIYGKYNLIQDFNFTGKFAHDLSVESDSAKYNVFRRGRGIDMNIDHHHHGQRFNLFTHLDMGQGSRPFKSSGSTEPQGISVSETYWCLKANQNLNYFTQYDNNVDTAKSRNNVAVGVRTAIASSLPDSKNNWLENINPVLLKPQDLYAAQLIYFNKAKYYEWPIFATRSNENGVPAYAVDGNMQTVWSASGNGDYLAFSLADTTNVNAIKIAFDAANSRRYRFAVQTSVDGISWTNALTNSQSSGSATGFELFKFGNRLAKYIKVIGLGCSSSQAIDTNLIAIKEVVAAYQTIPTADAYVRGGAFADSNYGKEQVLTLRKDSNALNSKVFLQFDITNVKQIVAVATLSLRIKSASNTNANTAKWQVSFVSDDYWFDSTITWNTPKTSAPPFSDTINGIGTTNAWIDWNVTNIINAETLSNESKVSLGLVNLIADNQSSVDFYAKEATSVSSRPLLTVEYKLASEIDSIGNYVLLPMVPKVPRVVPSNNNKFIHKIYPNPVNNILYIQLNKNDKELAVFDAFGKPVFASSVIGQKTVAINTGSWSKGIYFVAIINENGNKINTPICK